MKHSIVLKFIALLLCAASLLAAVGSGFGILYLTENGLYAKTVPELFAERVADSAQVLAQQVAQNYASTTLGGCPEEMLSNYHYLDAGCYEYTITDAAGTVLEQVTCDATGSCTAFAIPVSGSYMRVIRSWTNVPQATVAPEYTEDAALRALIPEEGLPIYELHVQSEDLDCSVGGDEPIGTLYYDAAVPRIHFISLHPALLDMEEAVLTAVTFYDADGNVPWRCVSQTNAGRLYRSEQDHTCYESLDLVILPEVTPTEAPQTSANTEVFGYFDYTLGEEVLVEYEWAVMPEYTVHLNVYPEALSDSDTYTLAGYLSSYRYTFPWLLAAGLLIFAITLVYLCCAAGRRPGTDEIRPAGLNRLPLDLYLALVIGAEALLVIACVEGGRALFREYADVGIGFACATAYLGSLLGVSYLFAAASQLKVPGHWWLRHTLCGKCICLIGKFLRWADRWAEAQSPKVARRWKAFWAWVKKAVVATYRFAETLITRTCLLLGRIIKALWVYGIRFILAAYRFTERSITRSCRFLGRCIAKFFSLLPLTWQWLVMGFALLFLIFLGIQSHSGGVLLVCISGCFALILYGAHCFGSLLESARKMRQGNLDAKVDDRLLLGAFRDFSQELNGLAGVATVAVQQQLRSERMKAELVTNVSHDIKTPLTSIINYVDLMKLPHSDEEHELYLEVLDRQSQRLKKLIEDLMEMSKANSGNMNVELTAMDPAEAMTQALGEFAGKLADASLTPVFRGPETPLTVMADGRLFWRVLSNLLNNACKYALPGTRLYIDLMALEGRAVLAIKNISREQLNIAPDELMERFVRGDVSRNTEGSGLGLNIARSLVELQGGNMELTVDGDLFKVTVIFPLV